MAYGPYLSLDQIRAYLHTLTLAELKEVKDAVDELTRKERLEQLEWEAARERTVRIAAFVYHGDVTKLRDSEHLVRYETRKEYLASLERRPEPSPDASSSR